MKVSGHKLKKGIFNDKLRVPVITTQERLVGVHPPSFHAFLENQEIPSNSILGEGKSFKSVAGMIPRKNAQSSMLNNRRNPVLNTTSDVFH